MLSKAIKVEKKINITFVIQIVQPIIKIWIIMKGLKVDLKKIEVTKPASSYWKNVIDSLSFFLTFLHPNCVLKGTVTSTEVTHSLSDFYSTQAWQSLMRKSCRCTLQRPATPACVFVPRQGWGVLSRSPRWDFSKHWKQGHVGQLDCLGHSPCF